MTDGGRQVFFATQLRNLDKVTGKYSGHTFLLPTGSHRIVDQDGDPATYVATEVKPGRQLIQLKALVGDYPYNVEYQAEDKRVLPLRADYQDGKQAVSFALPIGLLLTWLVMRLTRRRTTTGVQADGAVHTEGKGK